MSKVADAAEEGGGGSAAQERGPASPQRGGYSSPPAAGGRGEKDSLVAVQEPLLANLDAPELCRLAAASGRWHRVVCSSPVWRELYMRDFAVPGSEPAQDWFATYRATALPPCLLCKKRFWVHRRGGQRRCLCVSRRVAPEVRRLRLTVASLSGNRCRDGSFTEWQHHSDAREYAQRNFAVTFRTAERLSAEFLQGADLLVLHTTCAAERLSPGEQACLRGFLAAGGTAVINCFSQWTRNGGRAEELVDYLGVRPSPDSIWHSGVQARPILEPDLPSAHLWLTDPGMVAEDRYQRMYFLNIGETEYDAQVAIESGAAVPLTAPHHEQDQHSRLLWFPAACGAGQVLLSSNFHWLADRGGWHGGLFSTNIREGFNANMVLWHSVCAAACPEL
eukprot:TRINITY_DN30609_c0_g1_i1.p1 TRINITY_DN30609_c0_g1~~TRINITY_DN30609_c0_g1_i1.p1  ORF type:complete len:391 (+),score=68.24 TRINITY_DN30609_c0_g1_i1:76-1248(+)